jgi:hypothetical protein
MIYRSVIAAVVRALAAETMSGTGGQDFEPKVQCAKQKGAIVGKEAAMLADCIIHKLLHAQLSASQWDALVAKYSTHKQKKLESIARLIPRLSSAAPQQFTGQAVIVWAIPQVKGARRESVRLDAPRLRKHKDDPNRWDWRNDAAKAGIARANQSFAAMAESRSSDMIVLADSNYDMATWDNQGLTERTYQRWNKAIKERLESLVDEALVEAQHLLEAVGALEKEVA